MHLAPQTVRTFFVTGSTWGRRNILQSDRMADLLVRVCLEYREKKKFQLHEFVLMPDHFHMIITPAADIPLEKAVQFIKGGFSFRAKKELGWGGEVWSSGFSEHRIKDADDYRNHREYIFRNPVRRGLAGVPEEYVHSSASRRYELDEAPPALKCE